MGRVAERKGFSSDIDRLYRLITNANIRLQQLEAWADEVAGDDDGPGVCALDSVVDVTVVTQRQFQQLVEFLVPSVQFLYRVVDFPSRM